MAIFLIRHGETALNAARVVQRPETPLSARGLAQADLLAHRLADQRITFILASNLVRAAMTAERLQAVIGVTPRIDPDLQERNYGDVRGMAYSALGVNILAPDYEPPGGERWEDFHARVDRVWERVCQTAAETTGNLAVVTHGLVCYSLASRHLRLPPGAAVPLHWGNTSLTIVDAAPPWTVRLLNCIAHLDQLTRDDPLAPSSG